LSHEQTSDIDGPAGWGLPRYLTLIAVLIMHVVLLAALIMTPRIANVSTSVSVPIELLFIPPADLPKIRSEHSRPRRLAGNTAVSITPPVPASPSSSFPSPASGSDGNGSGVDWAAEARRAVQAFEIRSHQPSRNNSVSGSPAEDHWWPRVQHHAGDRFKTANGDWIVWINSSCYQIASSAALAGAPGATLPPTICPGDPGAAHAPEPDAAH
jgi:hypothetical protein